MTKNINIPSIKTLDVKISKNLSGAKKPYLDGFVKISNSPAKKQRDKKGVSR